MRYLKKKNYEKLVKALAVLPALPFGKKLEQSVGHVIDDTPTIYDDFVDRIAKFIDYFTVDHNTDMLLPDLGDFLSRGQVKSKIWLATELAKCVEGKLGNVVFYGGWYNFVAYFLFSQFEVDKVYSFDTDPTVIQPTERLYRK